MAPESRPAQTATASSSNFCCFNPTIVAIVRCDTVKYAENSIIAIL